MSAWSPPPPAYDWARARDDYLAGEPAGIVASRLGVTERTLHRHAAIEGWRRRDQHQIAALAGEPMPATSRELEPGSPLDMFVAATEYEVGELLLNPAPVRFIRFAFRRSAEAAVRGRVTEALAWTRLVASLERIAPGVADTQRAFNSADYIRAVYAAKLHKEVEGDADVSELLNDPSPS